ncbi:hypothetical protein B0O99DRAFT_63578 [Bisporella sp. PMI_857]|nr:hypothetical protein B0O99DRAFT_63578 [Bisporella sp. PMI_857]
MPHITTAMHRSMRRSVGDIVVDSLLGKRQIVDKVNSVKETFSSWDNCMAKTYCKWPIIAAIIVGGLIVLSVVWCIVRCACCGYSCCCSCFSFLKCCDCCGGLCDGKKNKPHKHLDDPFSSHAARNLGYQAPAPMVSGGLGGGPATPQFAQFEVGKNGFAVESKPVVNEDALPPMPSWDGATKKHVLSEDEKNAVELGDLDPATGQKMPLMTGAAGPGISGPPSPMNETAPGPYAAQPGQAVDGNGYLGVAGDAYPQNQNQEGRGYRGPGMAGQGYDGQGRGYGPPSPQDPYANNRDPYGGNQDPYVNHQDQFGDNFTGGYGRARRGQPERQYSNSDRGRAYPPNPQRQYSGDSRPSNQSRQYSDQTYQSNNYQNDNYQNEPYQQQPPRGPSRGPGRVASPLMNNSGFDFGGGPQDYSRPAPQHQQSYNSGYAESTVAPSYRTRDPQQDGYGRGYGQQGPPAGPIIPAGTYGGRGNPREPQNWDPVQR